MSDERFNFWVNYLQFISIAFVVMGLIWAVFGSFDPFGWYDTALAKYLFEHPVLTPESKQTLQFILGPFGATNSGYFVLQFFLVRHGLAQKLSWAYRAVLVGFLVWFFMDTLFCLIVEAYFNIMMVNLPALFMMSPIFLIWKNFRNP